MSNTCLCVVGNLFSTLVTLLVIGAAVDGYIMGDPGDMRAHNPNQTVITECSVNDSPEMKWRHVCPPIPGDIDTHYPVHMMMRQRDELAMYPEELTRMKAYLVSKMSYCIRGIKTGGMLRVILKIPHPIPLCFNYIAMKEALRTGEIDTEAFYIDLSGDTTGTCPARKVYIQ
uniref:Uncharacterized protein LOC102807392 n=1 Tax=Saccoglossus kowalevskii TaxID=10224 RepID=A0ABM0M6Q3_SACKO|nr:PREDICTED: uncharacterized protein LOC102807392 [Saccoglossus kowalevskii]